jgi:flagellar FliJ protein
MKKFNFRFEEVLKLRKRTEDQSLRELALAQRAYQEELAKKQSLLESLRISMDRRAAVGVEPTDVAALYIENDFIEGQKTRIAWADQAILKASKRVDKQLQNYIQTKRKTQVIERLREKELADYKKTRNKKEQRELDELTVMRSRLNQESHESGQDSTNDAMSSFGMNSEMRQP